MIKNILKILTLTSIALTLTLTIKTATTTTSDTIISAHQQNLLNEYNVEIITTDLIEDEWNFGFNPAGLYNSYIEPQTSEKVRVLSLDTKYVEYAFTHEYAHFLDDINDKASKSIDFTMIYFEEKDNFTDHHTDYARSSQAEYFASAYNQYIKNPSLLYVSCPKTFEFFNDLEIK